MRYTIGDVLIPSRRRPGFRSALACWWYELPARRRYWWWEVLLDPGQGWLRWKGEVRETYGSYDPPEPPMPYIVWPPLHRLLAALRYRERWPLSMVDPDRKDLWR